MMRLRELRQREGLTTYQMAERLDIDQGNYSRMENGKRNLTKKVIDNIDKQFGISEDELKKDFVLSNPFVDVLNNWIWKMKLNELPVVQSFIKDIGYLNIKDRSEHREVLEAFIRYIQFTIGNSIEREFDKNPKMIEYLISRLQR